jgi:hypothetical protein
MPEDRITQALRGPQPAPQPISQPDGFAQADQPSGTAQSGYVTPDLGPFECENCVHFQPPNQCNQQQVVSDPEVQGQVDPEGCCNFFTSAGNETQADEHSENSPEQEQ